MAVPYGRSRTSTPSTASNSYTTVFGVSGPGRIEYLSWSSIAIGGAMQVTVDGVTETYTSPSTLLPLAAPYISAPITFNSSFAVALKGDGSNATSANIGYRMKIGT